MIYKFENNTLELSDAKGTLFNNGRLVFKGFGYTAIQEYIRISGNDPRASEPFKKQLGMREKCRFTRTEKQADDS